MYSGSCNLGQIGVNQHASKLSQIKDTALSLTDGTPSHGSMLVYNDRTSTDSISSASGFVRKLHVSLTDLGGIALNPDVEPKHQSVLAYNQNIVDETFDEGWVSKSVSDLLESFQVTVEGLVIIGLNKEKGRRGNTAVTDCVAFTDTPENGYTMAICSCGDGNIVTKREPTDHDFVFLAVLDKGKILNLSLAAGTIFRTTKGISGFSSPFPMPFGLSSLSDTYFRFFAFRKDVYVYATSAGLESVVTLYASDGTTVVDGPYTVSPYSSKKLVCNANDEFVVIATSAIYCGTSAYRSDAAATSTSQLHLDMRLLPPMSCELIVWNRCCILTAQYHDTKVRWYRRNGETGMCTVHAGTPVFIYTGSVNEDEGATNPNAGNDRKYGLDGCLILKSDKPISGFAGADGNGWESTPGWPVDQLAQVFANPSTLNNSTSASISSITVASPYEGTATVYDSSAVLVTEFPITRGVSVSVTTSADQVYPAAGQWLPSDSGLSTLSGGYVETTVPAICIVNLAGSAIWSSNGGDELLIPGVSPAEIKADIVKDENNIHRLRVVDGNGDESWVVC